MSTKSRISFESRNRNVAYSKLMVKKLSTGNFNQKIMVARSGWPARGKEQPPSPSQLRIFKSSYDPAKTSQVPIFSISLPGAVLEEQGTAALETCNADSGASDKPSKAHTIFSLTTTDGIAYQFKVADEQEYKSWINLIKFLIVFPHCTVPDVPLYNPPAEHRHQHFDPELYGADSVWPVYILPDEIGSRYGIHGPKVLALQNQQLSSKLEIYEMTNHITPVISCNHSAIRRTGKLGVFLYVEVGRRCNCGPGLVWMYFGSSTELAIYMRDILFKFVTQQSLDPPAKLKRSITMPEALSTITTTSHTEVQGASPLHHRLLTHQHQPVVNSMGHQRSLTRESAARFRKDRNQSSEHTLESRYYPKSDPHNTSKPNHYHHSSPIIKPEQGQNQYHTLEPEASPTMKLEQSQNQYHTLEPEVSPTMKLEQSQNQYHTLEPEAAPTMKLEHGQNQYHILEPPRLNGRNGHHVLEQQPTTELKSVNQYHVLEPMQESKLDPKTNQYHVLESREADSKEHHYHVLLSSQKPKPKSTNNHCHVLEPQRSETPKHKSATINPEAHLKPAQQCYHRDSERGADDVDFCEEHQYDVVGLKATKERAQEQHQYHTLGRTENQTNVEATGEEEHAYAMIASKKPKPKKSKKKK